MTGRRASPCLQIDTRGEDSPSQGSIADRVTTLLLDFSMEGLRPFRCIRTRTWRRAGCRSSLREKSRSDRDTAQNKSGARGDPSETAAGTASSASARHRHARRNVDLKQMGSACQAHGLADGGAPGLHRPVVGTLDITAPNRADIVKIIRAQAQIINAVGRICAWSR